MIGYIDGCIGVFRDGDVYRAVYFSGVNSIRAHAAQRSLNRAIDFGIVQLLARLRDSDSTVDLMRFNFARYCDRMTGRSLLYQGHLRAAIRFSFQRPSMPA